MQLERQTALSNLKGYSTAPGFGSQNYRDLLEAIALNKLMPDQYIFDTRDKLSKKLSKARYPNLLIEEYILNHNYITKSNLAKAYSALFNIPYVSLTKYEIPKEVITLIPERIAKKYGIVAFYTEEKAVYIAVSRPALLRPHHKGVFSQLAEEKGVEIRLFITSPEHYKEALNWYHWQRPVGRIRLFETVIERESLRMIPPEDANRLRLLCFSKVPALFGGKPYYRVATDKPKSRDLERVIRFIEKNNNLFISLYRTSTADFETILGHYNEILHFPADIAKLPFDKAVLALSKPVVPPPTEVIPEEKLIRSKTKSFDLLEEIKEFLNALFHPVKKVPVEKVETKKEPLAVKAGPITKPMIEATAASMLPKMVPSSKKEESEPQKPAQQIITKHGKRWIIGKNGVKILDINYIAESTKKKEKAPNEISADISGLIKKNVETLEELEDIAMNGFVPQIVAAYLSYALTLEASDIHIEADEDRERIRFRIDGILRDIISLPLAVHPAVISRIKILSNLKIDETRLPQDGRFNVTFSGRDVDLRVSILPTVHGEKVVMRLLDKNKGILTLEEIGFTGKGYKEVIASIDKPYGIILATGPTGSGKSTTLYSIITRLSKPGVNITTLEDPVEFEIKGVNQSQIKPQIGFSFAEGLRSLMRQDPNIIMVGEIRDLETATNATHAALTGHLVLSTLHTNDAAGALPRLIAMGVEPFLITSSINCVIAQRLVRKICKYCKEEVAIEQGLVMDVEREFSQIPESNTIDRERVKRPFTFYKGKGCDKCTNGYKGRVGIFEVLPMSAAIEDLAVKNAPAHDILEQALKEGMITMKQDGYLKAISGLTTVEEVLRETKVD